MNSRYWTITAAMCACLTMMGAAPALAQHPAKPTCMDIKWNPAFLKSFPRAPAACQEVVERNGKMFARFTAKVTAVGSDAVTVRFLNVAGDAGREVTLKPNPDARVTMAGAEVKYSTLRKDDVLTFWVPEMQLGVIAEPDATAASTIVLN